MSSKFKLILVSAAVVLTGCGYTLEELVGSRNDPLEPQPPPPPAGCAGKSEAVCVADSACVPRYATFCTSGCVEAPGSCTTVFSACDAKPAPSACVGLNEAACISRPGCIPEYQGACPMCYGGACPPCAPNTFSGCVAAAPCFGLSEQQCSATPGCEPIISPCKAIACADPSDCPVCSPSYGGCIETAPLPPPDPCLGLDEQVCSATPGCEAVYGRASCPECVPDAPCACTSTAFYLCTSVKIDAGTSGGGPTDGGKPGAADGGVGP